MHTILAALLAVGLVYPFNVARTEENRSWPIIIHYGQVGGSTGIKCGICYSSDLLSRVYPHGCTTAEMSCPPYFDTRGKWTQDACYLSTCSYVCSQGHWFSTSDPL